MDSLAQILVTIAPVFGLILVGYGATVLGIVGRETGAGVAEFVFTLAIPALIFRTIVTADLARLDPLPIIATYFGAIAVVWVLATLLARGVLGRGGQEPAALSFAVGFGNVLILGLPIVLDAFGEAALGPVLVIVALDVPLMWLVATLQAAMAGRTRGQGIGRVLATLGRSLVRNPIIIATFAGVAWRVGGLPLPELADRLIDVLGKAALPGALFALGATLSGFSAKGEIGALTVIAVLKLAALPLLVWLVAAKLFGIDDHTLAVLTLAAACPTGVNAYLFAARYDAMAGTVAGAIAVTSFLSAITMSVVLALVTPA